MSVNTRKYNNINNRVQNLKNDNNFTPDAHFQSQPRKQNKFNGNKYRFNNHKNGYNANFNKTNHDEIHKEQHINSNDSNKGESLYQNIDINVNPTIKNNESIATVPIDKSNVCLMSQDNQQIQQTKSGSFVPSISAEQSIIDSTLPSDDSVLINNCRDASSSPSSMESECEVKNTNSDLGNNVESLNESNKNEGTNLSVTQNIFTTPQQIHHIPAPLPPHHVYDQQFSCSPYTNELTCNVANSIYTTNGSSSYEYDMHQQYVPQPPQVSPYYIYQYTDYAQVAAVNVAQTATAVVASQQGSSQSQQAKNNNSFYQSYQNPPFIYDPNMSLGINTVTPYSQTNQSSPHQQTILSSPQHQSTILASYQTPPPTQHQLYINPGVVATSSSVTSPSSISPSDSTPSSSNNNTTNGTPNLNDQLCSSPQTINGFLQIQQTNTNLPIPTTYQTPYTYSYYSSTNTNPYLTPQAYQSPMPNTTPGFLMYPPPPIQSSQINPTPTSSYSIYSNIPKSSEVNQNNTPTTPNTYKQTRFNNNRSSRYNKKYQNNNKSNTEFSPSHSSAFSKLNVATPATDDMAPQNTVYVDENTTPLTIDPNMALHMNINTNYGQLTPSMCSPMTSTTTASMCSPNSYDSYYDPGLNHPLYQGFQNFGPNGLPYDYEHGDITTYGDEYDENYDDNSNTDTENEQLACYVCRGRRMCFCYFLKVRYYKFPSFFDLMDHLTKKRRNANMKNKTKLNQIFLN